jgi:1-acyl-sn-glycerol-3-phosphate acyltransferase
MTAQLPEFEPPGRPLNSTLVSVLDAWFSPSFHGMQHLRPDRGSRFVGNHTIYGMLDIPLFQAGVYDQSGIWLRGLADHLHYAIPAWARFLESAGAIRGTRENCSKAMAQGDNLLVFPGGGREVMKRKGEKYQLIWKQRLGFVSRKQRLGFVSLAVEHGYPIQPFASVGAEEAYTIYLDAGAVQNSRLLKFMTDTLGVSVRKDAEEFPPIARGLGLTALPRPEPFYFVVGPAISTARYKGKERDTDTLIKLREKVAARVRELIDAGKAIREANAHEQPLWRSLLRKL